MSLLSGGWYFKHLGLFHKNVLFLTTSNGGISTFVFLYCGIVSLWDEVVWFGNDSVSRVQLKVASIKTKIESPM